MRVLVEQTYENIVTWLDNLDLLSGEVTWEDHNGEKTLKQYSAVNNHQTPIINSSKKTGITVYKLMGGEEEIDWDIYPERDSIIIGTQDMLLSRALNRGYAVSRFRWPIQYGLLNNDCLWVMDEIQLMGSGFSTSVQLEAFRDHYGTIKKCPTIWMSATSEPEWLETVDHTPLSIQETCYLQNEDLRVSVLNKRYSAVKKVAQCETRLESTSRIEIKKYSEYISELALKHHQETITPKVTLVIVNTVQRAQKIYNALLENTEKLDDIPEILLFHSRFRPLERAKLNIFLKESPETPNFPKNGRIIISTQVVEAGVDVSSKNLITELCPWASMVQRLGRLNRYGEWNRAKATWIDIDTETRNANTLALPYTADALDNSRKILCKLQGASPREIDALEAKLGFNHTYVIRKKDFLDLYDTTSDLSGNDVDVSRYIRDSRDVDVSVYWRDWDIKRDSGRPPDDIPRAVRDELCSVSLYSFRDFQKKHIVWMWDHLNERWVKPSQSQIIPGQVFLVHTSSGGYDMEIGWLPSSKKTVIPVPIDSDSSNEATGVDPYVKLKSWIPLKQHSNNTVQELGDIIQGLGSLGSEFLDEALVEALSYHDIGKAHPVFQEAVLETINDEKEKESRKNIVWGKSGGELRLRYSRRYFRHELASALMLLQNREIISSEGYLRDLVIYLVAAHHGKVRLSIRSLPGEDIPWEKDENYPEGTPFARGVWEGDIIPKVDVNQGGSVPETKLKLDYMGLGLTVEGEKSWVERMINLRDNHKLGPLRLGYLEAITRISDWRASMKESQGDY